APQPSRSRPLSRPRRMIGREIQRMKRSTPHSLRAPLRALALASAAIGLASSGSVLAAASGSPAPAASTAPAAPAAALTVAQTAVPAAVSVPASSVVPVVATAPNSLQSISVQSVNGTQVQLILHMSAPAVAPLGFAIDKPARISFDLPNTTLALPSRRIDVGTGGEGDACRLVDGEAERRDSRGGHV